MIPLPPGCTVSYEIRIVARQLDQPIINWFLDIGGVLHVDDSIRNYKGQLIEKPQVKYGNGPFSYHMQDGTGNVLIKFSGDDAAVASMFLIKFSEYIINHNLKEYREYA